MGGNRIDSQLLWKEYLEGKQTYSQLAAKYSCSTKTIQRHLDLAKVEKRSVFSSSANVVMDTLYFGRKGGVMVFKNSLNGEILFTQHVRYETNKLYLDGISEIVRRGISVLSIICDGRKGLFGLFGDIPVQMCQFHQIQIVIRYLTRRPKLLAGIELLAIAKHLTKSNKAQFECMLQEWEKRWKEFLNERTVSPTTGKSRYTHKTLRSAYRSLNSNLPYLFTYETYKELNIPNTTNALEGTFADLRRKINNHNGLTKQRKEKFVDGFFKA